MTDGIVLIGEAQVGTFEIELDDRVVIKFDKGISVKKTIERATSVGMPAVTLELLPLYEDQETLV